MAEFPDPPSRMTSVLPAAAISLALPGGKSYSKTPESPASKAGLLHFIAIRLLIGSQVAIPAQAGFGLFLNLTALRLTVLPRFLLAVPPPFNGRQLIIHGRPEMIAWQSLLLRSRQLITDGRQLITHGRLVTDLNRNGCRW